MLGRLFLLFTLVTLLEMFLLVKLAQWMGFGATVLLVLVTGVLGVWLARREGVRVLTRIRAELGAGRMPGGSLVDGLCVVVAGAFMMTPGMLTDLAGFALMIPAARLPLKAFLMARFERWLADGTVTVVHQSSWGFAGRGSAMDVDAEVVPHGAEAEREPIRPVRGGGDVLEAEVVDDARTSPRR